MNKPYTTSNVPYSMINEKKDKTNTHFREINVNAVPASKEKIKLSAATISKSHEELKASLTGISRPEKALQEISVKAKRVDNGAKQ